MSILNPYSAINYYNNEYIIHKTLNYKFRKLYENDVLLFDYIEQYGENLINLYADVFNELSASFENFNYYALTGHDSIALNNSTTGTYVYNLDEFSGLAGFNYMNMRYIWLLCSSDTHNSGSSIIVKATISGATAVDLETIFTDTFSVDNGSGSNGSSSMIPLPLHKNQTTLTIDLNKNAGTGYFQIVGASCIPTRI